jgi:hypothetical protein
MAHPASCSWSWNLRFTECRFSPSFFFPLCCLTGASNGIPLEAQQDLVSLSRRKVSFSFNKWHWHLQLEAQELGFR